MEGGEIKDPVQKGTPSYQDKIKNGRARNAYFTQNGKAYEYINLISHTYRVCFMQVSFYVPDKRGCRQGRMNRKGAMPMFGIFHSGEEILFSLDTIGNIAERRKHLLEEMPVMVYRLYEYIIKAKLTHRYEKKALKHLFYRVGRLIRKAYTFSHSLTTVQNFIRIHKIDVSRKEMFDYAIREEILITKEDINCSRRSISGETVCNDVKELFFRILNACIGKESMVTEIDSWGSGSCGCGFQVRVNL